MTAKNSDPSEEKVKKMHEAVRNVPDPKRGPGHSRNG
jgi:hypothetical protein